MKVILPVDRRGLAENSQDTVGYGTPADAQVNVACCPATTTTLCGGVVMFGAWGTPGAETVRIGVTKIYKFHFVFF